MNQETWSAVDRYEAQIVAPHDAALDEVLHASTHAGLPPINVSATQGKLLHVLALTCQAKNILEIGTLGGYSTIWLARALPPGGKIITLEAEPRHADVARENFKRCGLDDRIDLRLGWAADTLQALAREKAGPFDFIFVDADKQNIATYFDWSVKLARPGALIIVDNVVRNGAVIDEASSDESVRGVRRFNAQLALDTRVTASTVQTVGAKGYDGFTIARVNVTP